MKIPIVFAFDDNYVLPASVAIMSLQATRGPSTEYEVIVFHNGLRAETMRKFSRICPIRWMQVSGMDFESLPKSWTGEAGWFRCLIADLLPEYDRVIWSDGDVLFKNDLSGAYTQNIEGYDWLGVRMEQPNERHGVHVHFYEKDGCPIYASGFMVINARRWRENNFLDKCKRVIKQFGDRLTGDLDVLNLAADSIGNVSFRYCVLSNFVESAKIENAKEYPWIERTHGRRAVLDAVRDPIIVHYAGCGARLKPWERGPKTVPKDYWAFLSKSPFYEKRYFFPLCPAVVLWVFDAVRFLLSQDPAQRSLLKRRTTHWENMVRNSRMSWAFSIIEAMHRIRLSFRRHSA